jgi:hypothetical protein
MRSSKRNRRPLTVRYDNNGALTGTAVPVLAHPEPANSMRFVTLKLAPMQFVVLA